MAQTALILANGEPPPRDLLRARAGECDLFVCCDGALHIALAAGLRPQLLLGDLDSLGEAGDLAGIELLRLVEQETTDLEKAFYTLVARGFTRAIVLGSSGRRLDHAQAALGSFARYSDRLEITAEDAWGKLVLWPSGRWFALDQAVGSPVSLIPFPRATSVCTDGLRWELTGATLSLGGDESISNVVRTAAARVRYADGILGVFSPNGD